MADALEVFVAALKASKRPDNMGALLFQLLSNYPRRKSGIKDRFIEPIDLSKSPKEADNPDVIYFKIALPKEPNYLVEVHEHKAKPMRLNKAFQPFKVIILPQKRLFFFTKEGFRSPEVGLKYVIDLLNAFFEIDNKIWFDGKLFTKVKSFEEKVKEFELIKRIRIIIKTIPNPSNDEVVEWFHAISKDSKGSIPVLDVSGTRRNQSLDIKTGRLKSFYDETVGKQQAEAEISGVYPSKQRDVIKSDDFHRSISLPMELKDDPDALIKACVDISKNLEGNGKDDVETQ